MKNYSRGFTLLEILLVVGIISVLAGIVIVAINPSKQLATVRNTERKSDIKQLYNVMNQFYIDRGYYPASSTLDTTLKEVCDTGAVASTTTAVDGISCGTMINLSYDLVPTYIVAIPKDPQGPTAFLNQIIPTVYAAAGGTGYKIATDANRKIILTTARRELDVEVSIGTSTAVVAEEEGDTGCTATGGTETTVGGYKIHTFTTSGTLTVTSGSCDVDILVVAGGGGGGGTSGSAGGGGAGGLIYTANQTLITNSYPAVIGAGGAPNVSGASSTFNSLIALGGGYGGVSGSAASGGSGGGGKSSGGSGASGMQPTSGSGGFGNNGGNGATAPGGGGGAGAVGANAVTNVSGNGGAGKDYSAIFGTSVGASGWFAGGGGGGYTYGGTGGNGGGGTGGYFGISGPVAGTANTGGGGGGGSSYTETGASGGSGIVIVRYAI